MRLAAEPCIIEVEKSLVGLCAQKDKAFCSQVTSSLVLSQFQNKGTKFTDLAESFQNLRLEICCKSLKAQAPNLATSC